MIRRTIVVHGSLAHRDTRLEAARNASHGLQVLSIEGLAARLAGGFSRPIDPDAVRQILRDTLPEMELADLEPIRDLPGLVGAAVETVSKVWCAGIAIAPTHPRLQAISRIEATVSERLPAGMRRPADLVADALCRIDHAEAVIGPLELRYLPDLPPVWRPLIAALAKRIPLTWNAGGRTVPDWVRELGLPLVEATKKQPVLRLESTASALHEAIEALRWARELVASGRALPCEIAITACAGIGYDDHFVALRRESGLPLRFAHGVPASSTRAGQAAAALADILVRGLRRPAVQRFAALCDSAVLRALPERWQSLGPQGARARDIDAWREALRGNGKTEAEVEAVIGVLTLLERGTPAAAEAGERFLSGAARALWRKALLEAPAAAIDSTLSRLRIEDEETRDAIVWAPAAMVAASPRRFTRLLGMSSRGWPRAVSEDRLVPDHVLARLTLDPIPANLVDRMDFADILACTSGEVVLSRPRRDGEGRLLGRSPLIDGLGEEIYLPRYRATAHAMSEGDRLMMRAGEFADTPLAARAQACWRGWRDTRALCAHDGLVRSDHPAIVRVLARTHSASSIQMMLRDPQGFVWRYCLGLRPDETDEASLTMDNRDFGSLVHAILEKATLALDADGWFAPDDRAAVAAEVSRAADVVRGQWEAERAVPPPVIWRRQIADAMAAACDALLLPELELPGRRSYVEVAFGGQEPKPGSGPSPWRDDRVLFPGTDIAVQGFIDRIDLSGAGDEARVRDYKSGKPIAQKAVINGGRELQRAIYALAVRSLLGDDVAVSASLHYLKTGAMRVLDDPAATVQDLSRHVAAAQASLLAGNVLPGPDSCGNYAKFLFVLPANAANGYYARKQELVAAALGPASDVWGAI